MIWRVSGLPNHALTWLLVCVSAYALCSVEELYTKNDALVGEIADSEAIISKLMDAYVHPTATHALLAHLETAHVLVLYLHAFLMNYKRKMCPAAVIQVPVPPCFTTYDDCMDVSIYLYMTISRTDVAFHLCPLFMPLVQQGHAG
jgi:hypothetical protein